MSILKLQMHLSLDNYVNMENAGDDFKWDQGVIKFCVENLKDVDTILLGRKTAEDLIPFWDEVATNPDHKDFELGQRISELPKLVFSNSMQENKWKNTNLINGNLIEEIRNLKNLNGKKIMVYGGASFSSSLVKFNLIDEFYFLLNPFTLGKGTKIFKDKTKAQNYVFIDSRPFSCGIVLLSYKPKY